MSNKSNSVFVADLTLHQEMRVFDTIKGLASEVEEMDRQERQNAVEWISHVERNRGGATFWTTFIKMLLHNPKLIPKAKNVSEKQLRRLARKCNPSLQFIRPLTG